MSMNVPRSFLGGITWLKGDDVSCLGHRNSANGALVLLSSSSLSSTSFLIEPASVLAQQDCLDLFKSSNSILGRQRIHIEFGILSTCITGFTLRTLYIDRSSVKELATRFASESLLDEAQVDSAVINFRNL